MIFSRLLPFSVLVAEGQETSDGQTTTVSCMRDDVVEMTVNIEENSIGNEFNLDGWTLENGKYTRTWTAAEFADAEKTVTEDNNLVLTKSVNTSCKSGTYGDNVVCLEVGRKLNFRCKYQLGEKVVSSQVNVSGQDKEDDATTAEGTGELKYTMTVTESVEIGEPVKVSIVPKNPDLVFASIQSCGVSYGGNTMPLTTFDSNTLSPICVFGTEVQSASSTGNLGFSWNAFKWSSSEADGLEQQKVDCTIKLTKNDPNQSVTYCNGNLCPTGSYYSNFSNSCRFQPSDLVASSEEDQEIAFATRTLSPTPFKLCSNWELSVDLNLDLFTSSTHAWGNVFAVSVKYEGDPSTMPGEFFGSRIPGAWLQSNAGRDENDENYNLNRLHLTHQDGEVSKTNGLMYENASITGSAFNLKMSEYNGKLEIKINDELVSSQDQVVPTNFENVEATIGYLHSYSSLASGWYKNFKLWTRC